MTLADVWLMSASLGCAAIDMTCTILHCAICTAIDMTRTILHCAICAAIDMTGTILHCAICAAIDMTRTILHCAICTAMSSSTWNWKTFTSRWISRVRWRVERNTAHRTINMALSSIMGSSLMSLIYFGRDSLLVLQLHAAI